jgi:predicted nucleotide-binding protein/Mn-dependent DtxR family transcriptional regulator
MSLPIRATLEDVTQTCGYLSKKPTGANLKEIAGVVGDKLADSRRISALQSWGLIEDQDNGKYKITEDGRNCIKSDIDQSTVLQNVIRKLPPYIAIVERAAHRREDALTINDVAAHWHAHFTEDVSNSDAYLKEQVTSFFQIAQGAGLGTMIIGRRGAQTRFSFNTDPLNNFISISDSGSTNSHSNGILVAPGELPTVSSSTDQTPEYPTSNTSRKTGQGIFIAHGKNKKPLEQLKRVLEQFRIPYLVATEEPNLGRPISAKVRETMESCNCAILIFTADEEFQTVKGDTIWRPSENVVFELGASGYLYDNRLVIMKEEGVNFPSNFRDVGYISFEKDQLESKAMDVLRELIGFGIVKVST